MTRSRLTSLAALSLKGRVVAATVCLLATFMWLLTFLSATVLQSRLEELLAAQQFAFTRQIAAELEGKLQDRIDSLARAAALVPPDLSPAALQPFLESRSLTPTMFSGGMAAIGLDGKVMAAYPDVPRRRGADASDRDYFRQPVATGKPYIDKPFLARATGLPVLVIGVPVFDAQGKVRGVLAGITDLTAPNFLDLVADPRRVGVGEHYLLSVRDRIFVATSDKRRALALAPVPPRESNPQVHRMLEGFEGSAIGVNSEGIEKLYSAMRVPAADWVLLAALPTATAFAPVRTMRAWLFACAAVLTLLAAFLVGRLVRRVLAPLDEAGEAMRRMTAGAAPLAPLPVLRDDEVGHLIGNFNRLVDDRRRYEAALAESEQRFRLVVESAPEAIFVQTRGRFAYANAAALALFGAAAEQLIGSPIIERIHPDFRTVLAERIRRSNELRLANEAIEEVYLRLDGTTVDVEVSTVPFRYGGEDGALVFARDIGARKALERERSDHATRLIHLSRRLVATQEEERRRLSAALHDRTSANLAALDITLGALAQTRPAGDAAEEATLVEDARALLQDTTVSIREICADLRPPLLDYAGLVPALKTYAENFARRTGVRVAVDLPSGLAQTSPEIESKLFRIAQEAMTNCAKHAQATAIDIVLKQADGRIDLTIADDGVGFDPGSLSEDGGEAGLGLLTLQERVEFGAGRCEIRSEPGRGTRISVSLPVGGCKTLD